MSFGKLTCDLANLRTTLPPIDLLLRAIAIETPLTERLHRAATATDAEEHVARWMDDGGK